MQKTVFLGGWLVVVVVYIILSCIVPAQLAKNGETMTPFYIPMFTCIVPIIFARLWLMRMSICYVDAGGLCVAFICVLFPTFLGLPCTLFGAGEYYTLANGEEATGSIASSPALWSQELRPARFYFTDGYVAVDLAVSHRPCNDGTCSTNAIAPVYASKDEQLANVAPAAWAVPIDGEGEKVSQERCPDHAGGGGLCGTMSPYWHIDYGDIADKFKEVHPNIEVSEAMPYFEFKDPEETTATYRAIMIVGIVSTCLAVFVTVLEMFLEASVASKLTVEDSDSEESVSGNE